MIGLALFLLAALLVLLAASVWSMADLLVRPPRMTAGKAMYLLRRMDPSDLGFEFEPLTFNLPDHPATPAWWIDRGTARTAVLIHGYGDAKVGALAWARTLFDCGLNLLLIDLRGHGESRAKLTTGGVREADDLSAILDRLCHDRPDRTERIVLFGVSLGAAVAIGCAASRDDVAGVIADSPFDDFAAAATAHARSMRAPLERLLPLAIRLGERRAGVRFAAARPIDLLPRVACPVLIFHGTDDALLPEGAIGRFAQAIASRHNPRDRHVITESGHVLGMSADPDAYFEHVRAFVESLD